MAEKCRCCRSVRSKYLCADCCDLLPGNLRKRFERAVKDNLATVESHVWFNAAVECAVDEKRIWRKVFNEGLFDA